MYIYIYMFSCHVFQPIWCLWTCVKIFAVEHLKQQCQTKEVERKRQGKQCCGQQRESNQSHKEKAGRQTKNWHLIHPNPKTFTCRAMIKSAYRHTVPRWVLRSLLPLRASKWQNSIFQVLRTPPGIHSRVPPHQPLRCGMQLKALYILEYIGIYPHISTKGTLFRDFFRQFGNTVIIYMGALLKGGPKTIAVPVKKKKQSKQLRMILGFPTLGHFRHPNPTFFYWSPTLLFRVPKGRQ